MLNFAVGPVQMAEDIRALGSEEVPYFRTAEFSQVVKESEELLLRFAGAPEGAKAIFLTGSGTAAMEAAVINTLTERDRVIVVNGGSFGQRFVNLLTIHRIPFTEIRLKAGQALLAKDLEGFSGKGYTAFMVNMHETSTGVLYDMDRISAFCRENRLFLIVDAISAFLADAISMKDLGVDVMITGSQKALACPPGVSMLALSPRAIGRILKNDPQCFYLDLRAALKDGERGQTPFTPAVGLIRQINLRLKNIDAAGGPEMEIARVAALAAYFREGIREFPFVITSSSLSNAVTPLSPVKGGAYRIFEILKDEYGIWICPNGGEWKERIFRVGHIGALTLSDYDRLFDAFRDLSRRGLI